MSALKPVWMIKTFVKRRNSRRHSKPRRQGVVVVEYLIDDSTKIYSERTVAKWGPYPDQKRQALAAREAQQMIRKLEAVWPCAFLVKGYKWLDPPAHLMRSE